MFPVCDKKDSENFLKLSMIVCFALTLLSRGSSSSRVINMNKKANQLMPYVLCNPLQKPMIKDAVVKRSHDVLAKSKSGQNCENWPFRFCGKEGKCVWVRDGEYICKMLQIIYPNRKQSCGNPKFAKKCCCAKKYNPNTGRCPV